MSEPRFISAPVHFRLARFSRLGQWPEDHDERGRPLVHVAKEIMVYDQFTTAGSDTYRTYCGQIIYQRDLERFAGAWSVTCPLCRKSARFF